MRVRALNSGRVWEGTLISIDDTWVELDCGETIEIWPTGWAPGRPGVVSRHNHRFRLDCVEITNPHEDTRGDSSDDPLRGR